MSTKSVHREHFWFEDSCPSSGAQACRSKTCACPLVLIPQLEGRGKTARKKVECRQNLEFQAFALPLGSLWNVGGGKKKTNALRRQRTLFFLRPDLPKFTKKRIVAIHFFVPLPFIGSRFSLDVPKVNFPDPQNVERFRLYELRPCGDSGATVSVAHH